MKSLCWVPMSSRLHDVWCTWRLLYMYIQPVWCLIINGVSINPWWICFIHHVNSSIVILVGNYILLIHDLLEKSWTNGVICSWWNHKICSKFWNKTSLHCVCIQSNTCINHQWIIETFDLNKIFWIHGIFYHVLNFSVSLWYLNTDGHLYFLANLFVNLTMEEGFDRHLSVLL